VQQLNEWAAHGVLDVTKMSFYRWISLRPFYRLMTSGAALGRNCGPLIISNRSKTIRELAHCKLVLPGRETTAHFLFSRYAPHNLEKHFQVFSDIESSVLSQEFDAGVIIHENRFTYASRGLKKVADLGQMWEDETGLPIP